jgi:hypothetical protein
MENYYFHDGIDKFGPFSLEELKRQPLNSNTSVWKDGMQDWVRAVNFDELRPSFASKPPEFRRPSLTEKTGVRIGRNLGWSIVTLIFAIMGIWAFNRSHSQNTFLPLPPPVVDQERLNPQSFLLTNGTYKSNFWQTKWTINGNVSNFATHTNYKDVIVKVNFLSRTNTIIDSKQYVLYDYFPYGLKKGFNLEVDRPAAATTCGLQPVGATVY